MQFCTANGSRPSFCPTKITNLLLRWLCWKHKLFHLAASFSLDHSGGLFYPVLVDSTWTSCLGQAVSNNFMIFLLREGRRSVSLTAILMLGYELIFLRLEYLPPAPSSGKLNETPIDKKNLVVVCSHGTTKSLGWREPRLQIRPLNGVRKWPRTTWYWA